MSDRYILGSSFLQNYLTIYDYDSQRVGLAIHILSQAAVMATFAWWQIALIALGVVVVFPLIILGLYQIYKYRRSKRTLRATEAEQATQSS